MPPPKRAELTDTADLDTPPPTDGWHLGYLDAGVHVGYDADSHWGEQVALIGLAAEYEAGWSSWQRILMPTLGVEWELVRPVRSDVREAAGGHAEGELMALRFSGVELLPERPSWQATAQLREKHQVRGNMIGPRQVSAEFFKAIHLAGRGRLI